MCACVCLCLCLCTCLCACLCACLCTCLCARLCVPVPEQPARVRFHFLKASRVVHPDRNNTASDEQKFIATAVFNTLEQAFRVFEAAELNK